MKIRALAISENRIIEISRTYGLQIPAVSARNFLFELSELSEKQIQYLQNSDGAFNLYKTNIAHTFLIGVNDTVISPDHKNIPELRPLITKLKNFFSSSRKPVWRFDNKMLDFNEGPFVMGILNVTPDSFYDGAKYNSVSRAVEHALKMAEDGAKIVDIGGESTRPGAETVSIEDELARVIPVIKEIRKKSGILISIDTYKSSVARAALDAGADMVNDISGSGFDKEMIPLIKKYRCPYIIMHIKGTPKNMQRDPHYDDTLQEIYRYFEDKLRILEDKGLSNIMIDPGIGFGKRLEDNLRLIRDLKDFTFLNYPILVGASRKSMIGAVLNKEKEDRLYGSLSVHLQAAANGADVIRTHDVKATYETLQIFKAIHNPAEYI
jgi:dihydropteroate synthase